MLEKLRADQRTKLLPVIILTSSKEQRDIVHGYDLGANSYVRKPVDFEQFVEAVTATRPLLAGPERKPAHADVGERRIDCTAPLGDPHQGGHASA